MLPGLIHHRGASIASLTKACGENSVALDTT